MKKIFIISLLILILCIFTACDMSRYTGNSTPGKTEDKNDIIVINCDNYETRGNKGIKFKTDDLYYDIQHIINTYNIDTLKIDTTEYTNISDIEVIASSLIFSTKIKLEINSEDISDNIITKNYDEVIINDNMVLEFITNGKISYR